MSLLPLCCVVMTAGDVWPWLPHEGLCSISCAPLRVWFGLGLSRRALKVQIRRICYPSLVMRCALSLGRGSQAAQESSRDRHSAGAKRGVQCQGAPLHHPSLLPHVHCSSLLEMFMSALGHWHCSALELPAHLCPEDDRSHCAGSSNGLHGDAPAAPPPPPAPSQSPTCSPFQTQISVTEKMGISPLHCPRAYEGASDRKSRANWDLTHFYKWMGGGKDSETPPHGV